MKTSKKNSNVLQYLSPIILSLLIILSSGITATLPFNVANAVTPTTLFSSDFDSHNWGHEDWSSHTSSWQMTKNDRHGTHNPPSENHYKAVVEGDTHGNDILRKSISTAGYENITLSYWYRITQNLESNDHVYVEWTSNGSDWSSHELADYSNVGSGGWNNESFSLPAGSANNSNFAFRFKANFVGPHDEFRLDDVMLTGTEATPETGSITIEKITTNDDNQTGFDFSLNQGESITVYAGTPYTYQDLEAGTYDLQEIVPEGWVLDSATCDDGSEPPSISLDEGEDVICTFTNSPEEEGDPDPEEPFPTYTSQADQCPQGTEPILVGTHEVSSTDEDGEIVTLPAGGDYLFEASGTFVPTSAPNWFADAGYSTNDSTDSSVWNTVLPDYGVHGTDPNKGAHALLADLGSGVGILDWGDFNPSHIYSKLFALPAGDTQFVIGDRWDNWYEPEYENINEQGGMRDNSGSLTLNVYECREPQQDPEVLGSITVCKVLLDEEGALVDEYTPCDAWADSVVSFSQGTRKDGTPVLEERNDTTKALGEAPLADQDKPPINFVALGFGGEIVLGFDNYIINGTGDDLEVVETSYSSPICSNYPEEAMVYASQDGSDWTGLGSACLDESFDLGALPWARFVKIVDISNIESTKLPSEADGYDIDGVRALHCGSIPGGTFIIGADQSSEAVLGAQSETSWPSEFFTPLSFNTHLFGEGDARNAQCVTYDRLDLGGYYYGQEEIVSDEEWLPPLYNDQFQTSIESVADFFSYSPELFDENSENDEERNQDADGHIVLSEGRPDRTIVVLNQPEIFTPEEPQDPGDPKLGSITIEKITTNEDNQTGFDFSLNQGESITVYAGTPYTYQDLEAGTYDLQEIVPEGWVLDSATCDDGSEPPSISLDEGEDVICTFTNSPEEGDGEDEGDGGDEEENGGSSGGTTGGSSRSGGFATGSSGGSVLGASIGEVLGDSTSCGPYLNTYIKYGSQNDIADVVRLQIFLNKEIGANLLITGIYDEATMNAVNQYQLKYSEQILAPWIPFGLPNSQTPTGYVYKTTKWWTNMLQCPSLGLPQPQLP